MKTENLSVKIDRTRDKVDNFLDMLESRIDLTPYLMTYKEATAGNKFYNILAEINNLTLFLVQVIYNDILRCPGAAIAVLAVNFIFFFCLVQFLMWAGNLG